MMGYGSTDDILRDPTVPRRRGISMEVDRQVVSHLRRKLNRRMEKRLMEMEEAELLLQDGESGDNKMGDKKTPNVLDESVNIFTNYNDLGEKVSTIPRPSHQQESESAVQSEPLTESVEMAEQNGVQSSPGGKIVPTSDVSRSPVVGDGGGSNGRTSKKSSSSIGSDSKGLQRRCSAKKGKTSHNKQMTHLPPVLVTDKLEKSAASPARERVSESAKSKSESVTFQLTRVKVQPIEDRTSSPSSIPGDDVVEASDDPTLSVSERVELLVAGRTHTCTPPDHKHVQIFLHSQYTDTQTERSILIEKVYPPLKTYFRDRGYSLDVIDLKWGLRDHYTDDHSTLQLSRQLIDRCHRNQRCFSFITMLGQKYGQPMLPATVGQEEMECIIDAVAHDFNEAVEAAAAAAQAAEDAVLKRAAEDAGGGGGGGGGGRDVATKTDTGPKTTDGSEGGAGSAEESKVETRQALAQRLQRTASRVVTHTHIIRKMRHDPAPGDDFPDINLVRDWYKLDENARPPVYRLQNISTHYKEVIRKEPAKRADGYKQWLDTVSRLRFLLYRYAGETLGDTGTRIFNTSLMEIELRHGLLNADLDANKHCYWFRRDVEDIRDHVSQENVRDYIDLHPRGHALDEKLTESLDMLLQKEVPARLSRESIWKYPVNWHPRGISPSSTRSHVVYTDRLRREFYSIVTRRLDECIKEDAADPRLNDALYRELTQHIYHCQQKTQTFIGRHDLLDDVKRYVRSVTSRPLILHGKLGCGKTSVMSKVSMESTRWLRGQCSVIVRMVGVTVDSTNIHTLLRGLCEQICRIYGRSVREVPEDYKGLVNDFNFRLSLATAERPLVIILDALDRLSVEHEGRKMGWLPRDLPPHVHLIISMATDERYECFPHLKKAFDAECFLEVPELPEEDALEIWGAWIEATNRTITEEQLEVVMTSFRQTPLPLYLRFLFNEALSWPSFLRAAEIRLLPALNKAINSLFARLERDHGEPLVRRALGYISAARHGLTTTEIQDLLSLDDAVMDDITTLTRPQLRHLPAIYWARLRHQFGEFLAESPVDGLVTLRWTHTSFAEAATERYLDQRDKAPSYHKAMSEYFTDTWTDKPKPCNAHPKGVLRHTLAQPLYNEISCPMTGKTVRAYNSRRLSELPYHFLKSQQFDLVKKDCLCNFEFVMAKISGLTLRKLFEDIQMALVVEPADKDLALLSHTLHLSASALQRDPRQLASQVVGRLHQIITADKPVSPGDPVKYPAMKAFFRGAYKSSHPALIPSMTCLTPPGGILFDFLSGHTEPITAAVTTADGQKAITTSKDDSLKVWDLRTGRVVTTITGVGRQVLSIRLALGGQLAITSEQQCIRVWDLSSGMMVKEMDEYEDPASLVAADDGKLLVAFFDGSGTMRVWDLSTPEMGMLKEIDISDDGEQVVHMDHSILLAANTNGPQVLYSYRGSRSAYVRNAKVGARIHHLQVKTGAISALALSREYFIVAVRLLYMKLHEIFTLELFDIGSGRYIRGIRGCVSCHVTELHVNQTGSHVTSVCSSEANDLSDIAVWNVETEDHKHLCRHSPATTFGACADMRFMLTASRDENTLRIWNLSGKLNQPAPREKVKEGLEQILSMPDHPRYIMTKSGNDGPLCVWNVVKNKFGGLLVHSERGLVDHGDVLVIRNTKTVILTERGFSNVSEDAPPVYMTVLVYDMKEKKYMQRITGCYIVPSQTHEYVFLNDEQLMGLSENRNHFVIWSLTTGHVIHRIKSNFKYMDEYDDFVIDDDLPVRRRHQSRRMLPWERRAESRSARHRRHESEIEEERRRLFELRKEKENVIEQFMISKDLSTIVASYYGHHLCVFDVPSFTHTQTLENPSSMLLLHVAAITDSGSHLVHANYDDDSKTSYVTLWDCQNGYVKKRIKNERNVCTIALSDRGEKVVFGKTNKELRIWSPGRTNSLKRIKGYAGLNFGVGSKISIIDNGDKAIVFAGDVSVWDLESCAVLAVFSPDMKIQCLSVLMEGALIAFGLRESSEVVTLRLMSRDRPPIEKQGQNIFGEGEDSSDDDFELEEEGKPKDEEGDDD